MQIDPTHITPPMLPCTHAILQTPGLALYTDGSASTDKHGILRLGSGVYSSRDGQCLRIEPGGQGITADINRAELVAIQQALAHTDTQEDLTIYSDSLCSLQLINLHIFHPDRTRENKHRDLLQDIAIHIIQRHNAAATTRFLKVRSHSGIEGNDAADILAKEAANGNDVIGPVRVGEQAHLNMHWPSVQAPRSKNGDQAPRHPANNLTQGIKANLPTHIHTGQANTTGVYSSMWEQANPLLLPQASNRFWQSTDIKWWQKIQIHKARWGRLWTRKLAYRYKRPYGASTRPPSDDLCPLCRKAQDGASHILAGCAHPVFKGMYINRHNKAVQLIQKAAAKGALGALPMYMDAGTCEATQDIPTRPPVTLKPPDLPQATWDKYRPDLLLIDNESKPRKAYLVELGYCSDTNHHIKYQEKSLQHKEFQRILEQQGFLVHYLVFTIGTTGTIPTTTITNLSTLGISREHADKLIYKLHKESITSCTSILATRRMKESLPPGG
jgi:ribonuclease HI